MRTVEIVKAAPATFIEDLGRLGYGAVGVGVSGAADQSAHRLANRLVGNPESAATLEVTLGGLVLRSDVPLLVAVTGAPCPVVVGDAEAGYAARIHLPAGETLALGMPTAGIRSYVAIAGGIVVEPVLGSRSFDSMAKLGPAPVETGAVLPLGDATPDLSGVVDQAPVSPPTLDPIELRVLLGPRDDWVHMEGLFAHEWQASSRSDRVGVRLEGNPLQRAAGFADRELASEGVVRGSIQVPTGGLPVVFLADHPVTGGYPVVGVVRSVDLDQVAQARPGQVIRFVRDQASAQG